MLTVNGKMNISFNIEVCMGKLEPGNAIRNAIISTPYIGPGGAFYGAHIKLREVTPYATAAAAAAGEQITKVLVIIGRGRR